MQRLFIKLIIRWSNNCLRWARLEFEVSVRSVAATVALAVVDSERQHRDQSLQQEVVELQLAVWYLPLLSGVPLSLLLVGVGVVAAVGTGL